MLEGRPWRELSAKSRALDLLFVGSRGYGPLRAVLVRGTTGSLLREACCPVIALPRGVRTAVADLFDAHAPPRRRPSELTGGPAPGFLRSGARAPHA